MSHPYDSITRAQLEARGSLKWSMYPGAIGAWIAEMDFGLAPVIREALKVVDEDSLYGYNPPGLVDGLREATAEFYARRYGWAVEPHRVFPVSDVLLGMGAFLDLYAPPGARVVVPTPAYMPFLTVPGTYRREYVEVPQRIVPAGDGERWEMDFEALDAALAQAGPDGGPGGVLVLCNPHNPTGRVYTRAELARITEIVEKHGARVFSDEIHAPLTFSGSQHIPYASTSDAAAAHTVTLTSHSKSFNTPGLRCAQVIFSSDADVEVWQRHGTQFSATASLPGLIAGISAYREGEPWLADTLDYLEGTRDFIAQMLPAQLPQLRWIPPEGTYLAFFDCTRLAERLPQGTSPRDFFLSEAQVALNDGAATGRAGEGWVRFNMAMPRPIVAEALENMARAAAALDPR